MKKEEIKDVILGFLSLGLVITLILFVLTACTGSWNQYEVEAEVNKSERVCSVANETCEYLVFTNRGVFVNKDTRQFFKFNSRDIHGIIKEGNTYKFKVYGYRLRFFSIYPNIIEVEAL